MANPHSTKAVIIVCVLIAAVAFGAGYILKDGDDADVTPTPTPSVSVYATPTPTPTPTAVYKPTTHTVTLTSDGLSPASLSIRKGDTVILRNATDRLFWPASDPHPTHTACPGFDALRGLGNGESYTLTFVTVQTCGYHNHLDPANASMWGTITIR